MFRENVLINDRIIDRITGTMVPVAVDIRTVFNPRSKGARFLQPLIKPGNKRPISNETDQGIWVLAPDGTLLGRPFNGFGNMTGKTNRIIDTALKAFGPIRPRKSSPSPTHRLRGRGFGPGGRVSLAEYVRQSDRQSSFFKAPVMSQVTLTREQFLAFSPPKTTAGTTWRVPAAVARKLCRLTSPLSVQHAPQPAWVTHVELTARVVEVQGRKLRLQYDGNISTSDPRLSWKNHSNLSLTGDGLYDSGSRSMQSLLIVGTGTRRTEEFPKKVVSYSALVEWTRATKQTGTATGRQSR